MRHYIERGHTQNPNITQPFPGYLWYTLFEDPLTYYIAVSNMDARQAHLQREDDKVSLQGKIPSINVENEVTLTIQGQRAVQDIVDKALELFRRLQNFKLTSDSTSSRQSQIQSREVREALNTMKALFAKLRKIYEETNSRLGLRTGQGVKVSVYCYDDDGDNDI